MDTASIKSKILKERKEHHPLVTKKEKNNNSEKKFTRAMLLG